jgi:hypothetical protein
MWDKVKEVLFGLEVMCDLTDETLEGQLADKELRALLAAPNLSQSDGSPRGSFSLLAANWSGAPAEAYLSDGERLREAGCCPATALYKPFYSVAVRNFF